MLSFDLVVLSFLAILFWGFAVGWLSEGIGPVIVDNVWVMRLGVVAVSAITLSLSGWSLLVVLWMALSMMLGTYAWQFASTIRTNLKSGALTQMFVLFLAPLGFIPVWLTMGTSVVTMLQVAVGLVLGLLFYQKYGKTSYQDAALTSLVALVALFAPVYLAVTYLF